MNWTVTSSIRDYCATRNFPSSNETQWTTTLSYRTINFASPHWLRRLKARHCVTSRLLRIRELQPACIDALLLLNKPLWIKRSKNRQVKITTDLLLSREATWSLICERHRESRWKRKCESSVNSCLMISLSMENIRENTQIHSWKYPLNCVIIVILSVVYLSTPRPDQIANIFRCWSWLPAKFNTIYNFHSLKVH